MFKTGLLSETRRKWILVGLINSGMPRILMIIKNNLSCKQDQ